MPQETDRLKLPLPLGNETVTRESINRIFEKIDAGVATQADLDALREAVSKMDIPDASLTQKGKVQLSNKTDGTSELVAATEKAVRDAKNASLSRTGGVMTGRLIMNQWGTFSASSNGSVLYGSNCFLDGNTFKYENSHTNLGARGIYMRYTGGAGPEVYMFDTGPVTTTAGTSFAPTLNRIVNMGDSLQKHRVSQDDGRATDISGQNLNNILLTGWYKGNSLLNAPSLSGGWGYVEVIRHDENWVLQKVYDLHADRFYMRRRMDSGWTPWTQDLFQSGVDAKNGIVGAINAKGGSASTSDNWTQLSTKIKGLEQGHYRYLKIPISTNTNPTTGAFTVHVTYTAGTKLITLATLGDAIINVFPHTGGSVVATFALLDESNRIWKLTGDTQAGQAMSVQRLHFGIAQIDLTTGTQISYTKRSYSMPDGSGMSGEYGVGSNNRPEGFNTVGEIRLVTYCVAGDTRGNSIYTGFQSLISSSM
ncbi:pyocin knob domain-containing protein [Paenibacillus xylanexedens]|uniref:pyocin knob domain-containing protein n=1 Tax=Paenibacillus xylanexedens TaxID=528191 RepID=UPI00119CFFC2|nr:pyocin knob domain-containing protein [Paenibacillus xylanexedens]